MQSSYLQPHLDSVCNLVMVTAEDRAMQAFGECDSNRQILPKSGSNLP